MGYNLLWNIKGITNYNDTLITLLKMIEWVSQQIYRECVLYSFSCLVLKQIQVIVHDYLVVNGGGGLELELWISGSPWELRTEFSWVFQLYDRWVFPVFWWLSVAHVSSVKTLDEFATQILWFLAIKKVLWDDDLYSIHILRMGFGVRPSFFQFPLQKKWLGTGVLYRYHPACLQGHNPDFQGFYPKMILVHFSGTINVDPLVEAASYRWLWRFLISNLFLSQLPV